jgi:hypothetical protein
VTAPGVDSLITFTVGLIIGALGTVSVFRSGLAVLQTQVSHLVSSVGALGEKYERLERDMNGMGNDLRGEMRDLFEKER